MDRGQVWGICKDTGGRNHRRGLYHRKEKIIQGVWKWKINQVRNRLNCSLGQPTQGASILLVVMRGWLGPFLLDVACGLSRPRLVRVRSLDQGRSFNIDEAPESRKRSFCKSKGDQKYEQIGFQGLHHGISYPHTVILIFCA